MSNVINLIDYDIIYCFSVHLSTKLISITLEALIVSLMNAGITMFKACQVMILSNRASILSA